VCFFPTSSFAPHRLPGNRLRSHQFELHLRLSHGLVLLRPQGSLSLEDSGEGSDVSGDEGAAAEESDSSEDEVRSLLSRCSRRLTRYLWNECSVCRCCEHLGFV
jgi:hypothetical protein